MLDQAGASLPPRLASLVDEVVHKTRLRRGEKIVVAQELVDYFLQGVTDGVSVDELVATFGPPAQTAGLIRRSKIRCRSWGDRALLGSMLAVSAVAILLTAVLLSANADQLYVPIAPDDPASRPTSDITGIVKDEDGLPIADVEVLAVQGWDRDGARRTTRSDAEGRFSFDGLEPEGYWFLSVDDARHAWEWDHERAVSVPADPEDLPAEIMLYRPRTLRGRVLDERSRPVADARVVLINQGLPGRTRWVSGHIDVDMMATETDAEGRFTLDRLRPGRAGIALEHPEYAVTLAPPIEVGDGPVTLTILNGLTLRGRVMHEGEPVAGVEVRAAMNEARRPIVDWTGRTDAEGRFEVPRIRPREPERRTRAPVTSLRVTDERWRADDYTVYQTVAGALPDLIIEVQPATAEAQPQRRRIDVGRPEAGAPRIDPDALGTVNIRLDAAVEGNALVFLSSIDADGLPYREMERTTGDTATFEGVPPGRYWVSVSGGLELTRALPPKQIDVGAGQSIDVTLEPGPRRVTGVVRSGGEPVGAGHVSWFLVSPAPAAVYQGGVYVQPDGTYTIEGLTEGTYRFIYSSYGAEHDSLPGIFMVDVSGDHTAFDIDLPTSRIEGALVGRTPEPADSNMGGRNIRIRPRGFPPKWPSGTGAWSDADADGRFTIEHVAPGHYTILGYGLATSVTVERDGSVIGATLRPPDKTGEIVGTITGITPVNEDDARGNNVTAFPKDDLGYHFVHVYSTEYDPMTGAYRLRGLPPGEYGVLVGGYRSSVPYTWVGDIEVREGFARQLPIDVPQGRTVRLDTQGRVSDRRLRVPSGDWLESIFTYEFSLPFGRYALEVAYDDGRVVSHTFTVEPGAGPQNVVVPAPQ